MTPIIQSTLLSWRHFGSRLSRNVGEQIGETSDFKMDGPHNQTLEAWGCSVSMDFCNFMTWTGQHSTALSSLNRLSAFHRQRERHVLVLSCRGRRIETRSRNWVNYLQGDPGGVIEVKVRCSALPGLIWVAVAVRSHTTVVSPSPENPYGDRKSASLTCTQLEKMSTKCACLIKYICLTLAALRRNCEGYDEL